jgi:hypothetical protein
VDIASLSKTHIIRIKKIQYLGNESIYDLIYI